MQGKQKAALAVGLAVVEEVGRALVRHYEPQLQGVSMPPEVWAIVRPLLLVALIAVGAWVVIDYIQLRRWVRRHRYPPFWRWLETDEGRPYKAAAKYSADGLIGAWEDWKRLEQASLRKNAPS